MRPALRAAVVALAALLTPALVVAAGRQGRPRMVKPQQGKQIVVGPVAVPSGQERTGCTYLKLPGGRDLAVNRVKIKVRGGSHHIHLYRPTDRTRDIPDGRETCDFALNFDEWELILASQSILLNWKLPRGIAFHFRAGEQLVAQTHFVDSGLLESPRDGWAMFNLYSMPEAKVTSYVGSIFGQDRDIVVPAHAITTATTRCVFPKPVNMLALTGHYHFRGVRFTANVWDGTTTGPLIYEQRGYSEPAFRRYREGEVAGIPGLEWTCTYDNQTDQSFEFGPFTDRNEHCNLFAFYYPSLGKNEFLTCVQEDQQVTVTVRD